MFDITVEIEQIDKEDLYCDSGHYAKPTFKRDGPNSNEESVRFFKVSSKDANGIYCEPCLILANYIKAAKKLNPNCSIYTILNKIKR